MEPLGPKAPGTDNEENYHYDNDADNDSVCDEDHDNDDVDDDDVAKLPRGISRYVATFDENRDHTSDKIMSHVNE